MKNRVHRAGFTLIEMLVAMAMTAGLLTLLLTAMLGTSKNYDSMSQQIDTRVEARAALGLLTRDVGAFAGEMRVSEKDTAAGWAIDSFSFLSRQSTAAQTLENAESELCHVFYYPAYSIDDEQQRVGSRKLYRGLLDSAETFDHAVAGKEFDLPTPTPETDEPVAFGVVSFDVEVLKRSAGGSFSEWTDGDDDPPALVEITLVVTHRQILPRLPNADDWESADGALGTPETAEQNRDLYHYETRIHLSP